MKIDKINMKVEVKKKDQHEEELSQFIDSTGFRRKKKKEKEMVNKEK